MIGYRFHPQAAREVEESAEYYDSQPSNLGDEFLENLGHAISFARRFPEASTLISRRSRRKRLRRFPYSVIYQILDAEIAIVAAAHLRRKPEYWISREI